MSIIVRSNDPVQSTPSSGSEAVVRDVPGKQDDASAPVGQTPAEQNESSESDTEEKDDKEEESDETESQDSDTEKEPESDETEKEKPGKKKGGFQRRIDKLNQRYAQKEQELEYWKQQALKGAGAPKTESNQAEAKATPAQPASSSEGKPSPDDFNTHGEYVEALTDWKVDQKEKAREAKLERSKIESEQEKISRVYSERAKAYSAKQADFDEVISAVDTIQISATVREIILTSDNGPELAYALAKNPDEFARVCKLPPLSAAREMGKLELKLSSTSSQEKVEAPQKKTITQAPKPIEPVKAGKGSATKSIYDPSLSQADYEKLRREQTKRRQA